MMRWLAIVALAVPAILSGPVGAATAVEAGRVASAERVTAARPSLTLSNAVVTQVDGRARTFTAAIVFSGAELSELPSVGTVLEVAYRETPDARIATTVKSGKSNSSDRVAAGRSSRSVSNATVTKVDREAATFAVGLVFSAARLRELPAVGSTVDITYTEGPDGGPMETSNLNLSKSNID